MASGRKNVERQRHRILAYQVGQFVVVAEPGAPLVVLRLVGRVTVAAQSGRDRRRARRLPAAWLPDQAWRQLSGAWRGAQNIVVIHCGAWLTWICASPLKRSRLSKPKFS